jgi:hypothetical protein
MALVRELLGKTPKIGENTFLAETAVIIGDVEMGKDCSIWYNAVIRGDVHYIKLGNKVNVQDNVMLHCTYEKFPLVIGNNVSIGHNACVHGCTIHDNVLIGMNSVYERMKAKGVDTLGNDLAPFNMALADYADNVISFKELIDITIDTLKGNAKLESTEIEDPCLDAKIKYICETVDMIPSVLHEGLGSIIKDLVTGDIDKEIKELQSDVRDIHTPEQQRLVVTKIVNVLERLIQLRHSPGKIETFVHDSTAMLQRLFGNRDAGKELKLRTSEAISKLAHLRDQALAKKWDNSEYNEKVAQLRDRVQELMKKAEDYDE